MSNRRCNGRSRRSTVSTTVIVANSEKETVQVITECTPVNTENAPLFRIEANVSFVHVVMA